MRTPAPAAWAALTLLGLLLAPLPALAPRSHQSDVDRGRYLVDFGGCHDCHSPKVAGPVGPVPDTTRLLSGHPADVKVPPIPAGVIRPDGWAALASADLTAWGGPWGVSFSANLSEADGRGSPGGVRVPADAEADRECRAGTAAAGDGEALTPCTSYRDLVDPVEEIAP